MKAPPHTSLVLSAIGPMAAAAVDKQLARQKKKKETEKDDKEIDTRMIRSTSSWRKKEKEKKIMKM